MIITEYKNRFLIYISLLGVVVFCLLIFWPSIAFGYNSYTGSISSGDQFLITSLPTDVGGYYSGFDIWYGGLPNYGGTDQSGSFSCGSIWYPTCYNIMLNATLNMSDFYHDTGYHYIVWYTNSQTTKEYIGYHRLYALDEDNWSYDTADYGEVLLDDPESGTEITDLETEITVSYADLGYYEKLYIYFKHKQTGIQTEMVEYLIDDIGGSGTVDISLTEFNFDKNGTWHLYASAVYQGYQYVAEYYLSGFGYVWKDYLTNETDNLIINISGFTPMFAMSDFEEWYEANVSTFGEPTEVVLNTANFLSPIFAYTGEFGERIRDFFASEQGYLRGYELGKAIPVFSHYLGAMAYFIGGFPVISLFFISLFLMVGIFIFKLVIRFIPHFGS